MTTLLSVRGFAAAAALAALTTFSATGVDAQESAKKATPVAKAQPIARAVSSPKIRPLSASIDLHSNTKLIGTLTDTTTLEMRTSFGTANIPLSEVAGIRFASASDSSTTVVMLNGDSITGATDVKLVTVETEWGIATINGPNIGSIMFVPGLSWAPQAGLNGNRWNLANVKKTVPSKPAAPTASASSSTASRSTAPTSRSGYPSSAPTTTYRGR